MLRINNDWSISGSRSGFLWMGCMFSFLIGVVMENMKSYFYIFMLFMACTSEISQNRRMKNFLLMEWFLLSGHTMLGMLVKFFV